MNVQPESPPQRSPWLDEWGAEMRTMSGTSTPNSRDQLSRVSSRASEAPLARPSSSASHDTLCDPLHDPLSYSRHHFSLTPPPYASFVMPRPDFGLHVPPLPEPLRRQQPAERVPLMAALRHSQEAARAPVTHYTSNVATEAEQRRIALGRIDARKALIRAALLGLRDARWCDHAQYNLVKHYIADVDERFGAGHSVLLARGLHLSQQGFCIEAELSHEQDSQLFYKVLEPRGTVYVPPARAAQNAGCLRMVQARGLLQVLDRAALGALLDGLPAQLQLEEGRVYRPGPVLAATAGLWALQSLCCLPMVPVGLLCDDLNRAAEDVRAGEEDFQFWRSALATEDRARGPLRPHVDDLLMQDL